MKQIFIDNLEKSQTIAIMYDIKEDDIMIVSNSGKFIISFTTLDVNELHDISTCGSIFVIYKKQTTSFKPANK